MDTLTERLRHQDVLLEQLKQTQVIQQQQIYQLKETTAQQQQHIQLLQDTNTVQQQHIYDLLEITQIIQRRHQQQQMIPWQSKGKSLEAIRKPKFIAALRELVGGPSINRKMVDAEFKGLQEYASKIMWKIIASYCAVHGPPDIGGGMLWKVLPDRLKQLAIAQLELMVTLDIHRAQDHWMAAYLMNEQCTEIRWHMEPRQPVEPDEAFVAAIREAAGMMSPVPASAPAAVPFSITVATSEASASSFKDAPDFPGSPEPSYVPDSPGIVFAPASTPEEAIPWIVTTAPSDDDTTLEADHLKRQLEEKEEEDDEDFDSDEPIIGSSGKRQRH